MKKITVWSICLLVSMLMSFSLQAQNKPDTLKNGFIIRKIRFTTDDHYALVVNYLDKGENFNIWDLETRKLVGTYDLHNSDEVFTIALHPSEPIVASVSLFNPEIKVWELLTGKVIKTFKANKSRVWCLQFSPDGNTLLSGGDDALIRLWDWKKGKQTDNLKGNQYSLKELVFCPNSSLLLSLSHSLRKESIIPKVEFNFWDWKQKKLIKSVEYTSEMNDLTLSPNGKWAILSGITSVLEVWDLEKIELANSLPDRENRGLRFDTSPEGLEFSPNSAYFIESWGSIAFRGGTSEWKMEKMVSAETKQEINEAVTNYSTKNGFIHFSKTKKQIITVLDSQIRFHQASDRFYE